MQTNKMCVSLYGSLAGTLELDKHGKMLFSYYKDAVFPISLSMPLKERSFDDKHCRKFFRGLLPEDSKIIEVICQILDLNPKDTFHLLQRIGQDCAGAISFCSLNDMEKMKPMYIKGRILSINDLKMVLKKLHKNPLNLNPYSTASLLAGHAAKIAVCLIDNKIAMPEVGSPTTHILKYRHPSEILNEYFCLLLAKSLGLQTVNAQLYHVGKMLCLLIERYDREIVNFYQAVSLHQEDFAQALSYFSSRKYEWDKGPSLKDCFALMLKTTVPAIYRNELIKRVIFYYFIGNTQAHAKNMSILYQKPGQLILAPLYAAQYSYPRHQQMAMKIGMSFDIKNVSMADWQLLCKTIGYTFPIFKEIFNEIKSQIYQKAMIQRTHLSALGHEPTIIDEIVAFIQCRTST